MINALIINDNYIIDKKNLDQVDSGIPKNYDNEDIFSALNQQASQNNLSVNEPQTKEQPIQQSEPQSSEHQMQQNSNLPPLQEPKETFEEVHHHPKKFLGNKGKIKQLNKNKGM